MAACALAAPATVHAAVQYELQAYGTKCVSGQVDERQYTYTICHDEKRENYLRVHDPAGNLVSYTRMPGANDVAPAPDGSYVYVSGGGDTGPLRRFIRQGTTYVKDDAFRPPTFEHWGYVHRADGRQIATDAYGNLYIANGAWMPMAPHVVTKYGPDGRLITKFGDFTNTWAVGFFYTLGGIGVSRDGRHIYTSEIHNGRVQRFDQRPDGHYQFALAWGNTQENDPNRTGRGCVAGSLSAPYDLAVDPWGDVWTTSTSCTRITKWSPTGQLLFTSYAGNRGPNLPGGPTATDSQQRSHNLAVTARGDVIVGETSNILVRQGPIPPWPALDGGPAPLPNPNPNPNPQPEPQPNPNPAPGPDLAAPTVTAVTVPATSRSQVIDVTIAATDDVGVTQVRFADDWGVWQAWQPYSAQMRFSLRAGIGLRGIYTQVRDAAGRESNVVYRTLTVTAQEAPPQPAPQPEPQPEPEPPAPQPEPQPQPQPGPDRTAPRLRQVTIPATSATSAIDVVIDAIDDRGITQVRMADDWGEWRAWQPYAPTMRFTLRAGAGFRGVYVQVRDAAGNESTVLYRTTRVL